jgi:hypothetical protein
MLGSAALVLFVVVIVVGAAVVVVAVAVAATVTVAVGEAMLVGAVVIVTEPERELVARCCRSFPDRVVASKLVVGASSGGPSGCGPARGDGGATLALFLTRASTGAVSRNAGVVKLSVASAWKSSASVRWACGYAGSDILCCMSA